MVVICKKRKILGRGDNTGVVIKGGKVVPANRDIIDKKNAELRRKCAKQKENDADALIAARSMVAGRCCSNSFIAIEDASVIKCDSRELSRMDSESIMMSYEQQMNEVGLDVYAHDMVAGGMNDDMIECSVLTKKRRF
jgi:hypothetical protein